MTPETDCRELALLREANTMWDAGGREIGPRRLQALLELRESGSMSPTALAGLLGFSAAGASQVISRLLECGYITSTVVPSDRRAFLLTITDDGLKQTERLTKTMNTEVKP